MAANLNTKRLEKLEKTISDGLSTWVQMAKALVEIRDGGTRRERVVAWAPLPAPYNPPETETEE